MRERLRRDPGLVLLLVALFAAAAIYAPTVARGLVNVGDPWLVRDNWILGDPSWASLHQIWFDLRVETRHVLGTEYLPLRDLSLLLDHLVWGDWYGGFHLTSLVLYLGAVAVWFTAFTQLGIDRRIVGVMAVIWALHPTHAESVAWVAARGTVLGALFAGVTALAFARFRAGRSATWLAVALLATLAAVWSYAPSACVIALLAALELVLPGRRVSWGRRLGGLGALAGAAIGALIPVISVGIPQLGSGEAVLGAHGFALQLGAVATKNSPSYAIQLAGPSAIDISIGVLSVCVLLAVAFVPARAGWRLPTELRSAAVLWLFGWFPLGGVVSDRDLMLPTLGVALALGSGFVRIASPRARRALLATIVIACALRSLDASSNWRDSVTLWRRAVDAHPADGNAWGMYAESVMEVGRFDLAFDVISNGLRHSRSPRLLLRKALLTLHGASRENAIKSMREAAVMGEPRAMINLALLLRERGNHMDAFAWATRGAYMLPLHAPAQRALGSVALAANHRLLALVAFERALHLEPRNTLNKYNVALALIALGRRVAAERYLAECKADPSFVWRVRALVDSLRR